MEDHELVSRFESLGHGCEFGVFQRFCGAEPLGLFRFMAASLDNIHAVIAADLDFFTADDFGFRHNDLDREYVGYSRRYNDFDYHTFLHKDEISEQALIVREARKLGYMKTSFASILAADEKIMVRTGDASLDQIEHLAGLLHRRGARWLLWVVLADEDHAPGAVETIAPGLMKGYLARYAQFHDEPRIDVQVWLRLCKAALALVEDEQHRPRSVYRASERIDITSAWRSGAYAHLSYPDPRSSPPARSFCFHLAHDVHMGERLVSVPLERTLPPRSAVVFSVWILVPRDFVGVHVEAHVDGIKQLHRLKAELSRRDTWQQIWCAGRIAKQPEPVVLGVRVAASAGSQLFVAGWRFETGTIPSASLSGDGSLIVPRPEIAGPKAWARAARLGAVHWLRRRRQFARADRAVERGLSLYPHDIAFYLASAQNASARRDWALAAIRWLFALRAAPGLADSHLGLAEAFLKSGEAEKAAATLMIGRRLFPDDREIQEMQDRLLGERDPRRKATQSRRAQILEPSEAQ